MATPAPPGFTVKPVTNRNVGGLVGSKTLGVIEHVQVGNGSLAGYFNNPKANASSTWWVGKRGEREQYGNPDTDKFWAQAAGNPLYHSVETEGDPSEPLTPQQVESFAQILAWGHQRYGWALALAEAPGQRGLGWHGMGGKAWGNHPYCPGTIRKAQRGAILARAKQIATSGPAGSVSGTGSTPTTSAGASGGSTLQEDPMPDPIDLWRADIIPSPDKQPSNPTWQPDSYLRETYLMIRATKRDVAALQATVDSLTAAVTALASAKSVNPDDVLAIIREKVAQVKVQLTVSDEAEPATDGGTQ